MQRPVSFYTDEKGKKRPIMARSKHHRASIRSSRREVHYKRKVIPELSEGDLTKYGYTFHAPEAQRHAALRKAVAKYGKVSVERKLGAILVLDKNRAPEISQRAREDIHWIATTLPDEK